MSLFFRYYPAVPALLTPLFFGPESRSFRDLAADPNFWKLFVAGAPLRSMDLSLHPRRREKCWPARGGQKL
jgi:hypothetical protein